MAYPAWLQSFMNSVPYDPSFWRISNPAARAANEGGVDIPSAAGTPVYALASGVLESSHLFWHNPPNVDQNLGGNPGYGVVSERVNVPGFGLQDLYYQHIQINPALPTCEGGNCGNTVVQKGQLLGWVTSGVNEVEVGVNPQGWGPVWGPGQHPGPWVDPDPMIRALVNANPNFGWGSQTTTSDLTSLGSGPDNNQPSAICQIACAAAIDPAQCEKGCEGVGSAASTAGNVYQALTNPQTWIRAGIIMFGAVVILIGIYKVFDSR